MMLVPPTFTARNMDTYTVIGLEPEGTLATVLSLRAARQRRRRRHVGGSAALASYENTSSIRTPSATAIRNATSSDGEYLPASIALIVCRVTPTRSARSCCVISLCSKRSLRIVFVMAVCVTSDSPPVVHEARGVIHDLRKNERQKDAIEHADLVGAELDDGEDGP